jgi:hypothetical protein
MPNLRGRISPPEADEAILQRLRQGDVRRGAPDICGEGSSTVHHLWCSELNHSASLPRLPPPHVFRFAAILR